MSKSGSASNSSSQTIFNVLRELCKTDRPLGVADLHRIVDEPTSSTHRALMTLEEAGLATRFGRQIKFGPGPTVQNLVRALISRFPLRKTGMALIDEISDISETPVTLNARLGWYSIRIGWIEGRQELHDQRRIGQARLLHEKIAPIAMLSTFSEPDRARYLDFVAEAHPGDHDAAASPSVHDEIEKGRALGFFTKANSQSADSSWVSFALHDTNNIACGAVTVAVQNAAIPSKGQPSPLFDDLRRLVGAFQAHLLENPEETQSPYSYLADNDIRLQLANEAIA